MKCSKMATSERLLFVHQSKEQKALMERYGNHLCLLDATWKTTMYVLPLFFLAVKINIPACRGVCHPRWNWSIDLRELRIRKFLQLLWSVCRLTWGIRLYMSFMLGIPWQHIYHAILELHSACICFVWVQWTLIVS